MVKRIREQEQLVYGIGVRVTPGLAFRGYGTISAGATTEPEKATRLAEVVNEMMVEFATTGPTDEEMQIVRGQISNALDEQMREPSYWEFNVADMTLRDTDLDDVNAGMAPYDAFTAAQVRDAVARYYRDDSRFTVIVRPDTEAQAGAGNDD
jgi:predicted Zn-dependent peptidase